MNKTGLSFSFFVKATALKQQMAKFYPHSVSTEASDHILYKSVVIVVVVVVNA